MEQTLRDSIKTYLEVIRDEAVILLSGLPSDPAATLVRLEKIYSAVNSAGVTLAQVMHPNQNTESVKIVESILSESTLVCDVDEARVQAEEEDKRREAERRPVVEPVVAPVVEPVVAEPYAKEVPEEKVPETVQEIVQNDDPVVGAVDVPVKEPVKATDKVVGRPTEQPNKSKSGRK